MSLIGVVKSNEHLANGSIFQYAPANLPCIVIDCANYADPHRFYPSISLEDMQQIYVFELELLHRYRNVLKHLPIYGKRLNAKSIIVTTSDNLINYRDEDENRNIYLYTWQLLRIIGKNYKVFVAVTAQTEQYRLAKRFCNEILEDSHGAYGSFTTNGN